ncbi:MAG: RNB domain-containing ribonuclease [Treponema sp.]|nr:RNB domain-containing ribonuclease [Treponema sp.]
MAYKNRPALVSGREGEKLILSVPGAPGKAGKKEPAQEFKVREKDLEYLHPGPCSASDAALLADVVLTDAAASGSAALTGGDIKGAWELLADSSGEGLSLKELAELVWGEYSPQSAWGVYLLLQDGLFFTGEPGAIRARSGADLEAEEKRRAGKERDLRDREAFLERLRARKLDLPADGRFMQDAEALALGKSDKSRTVKDAGLAETPEEAHRLLLETGFWTPFVNPHPQRFGLPLWPVKAIPDPPPQEDRADLTGLAAFAIDNPWSDDPDDAVSLEVPDPAGAERILWVHVADPAASVGFGSPAEREARNRGATFYLPEGTYRMIAGQALPSYALGMAERSPALSFKITLDGDGSITGGDVLRSWVSVTRLSYGEADRLVLGTADGASAGEPAIPAGRPLKETQAVLSALFALGDRNLRRRLAAGGVSIGFPEVHISVRDGQVFLEPVKSRKSADMVRECMLLAGEGAAWWVSREAPRLLGGHRLPFPYIGQETGDLPANPLPGLAGSWQLRRAMRPRSLSLKPSLHQGLGLGAYTQVTSPLRRYTDLLAHQQIRSVLRGEPPLDEDETLLRMGAGEAAMGASVQAERASRAYWTAVYLLDKAGSRWEGVVLEKKGPKAVVMIPDLGLETQVSLKKEAEPNDPVTLSLLSVRLSVAEAVFSAV